MFSRTTRNVLVSLLLASSAQAAEINLICVGDSLTEGSDWMVNLAGAGYSFTYVDVGQAGEDSWDAATGIHASSTGRFRTYLSSTYPGDATASDTFVLFYGTNDVRRNWGVSPNEVEYEAAMEQMLQDALALGRPVVLVIPPGFVTGSGSTHDQAEVDEYNGKLENEVTTVLEGLRDTYVAAGWPVALVDARTPWKALPGQPDLEYYALANGVKDGVHPGTETNTPTGKAGRRELAEIIGPFISQAQPKSRYVGGSF